LTVWLINNTSKPSVNTGGFLSIWERGDKVFVDEIEFNVKGGNGGNGVVSFRREKFIDMGGPDGGDGGDGGSVILKVDEGLHTLADFRYNNYYKAERGRHGKGKNCHGRSGEDIILRVPSGTIVYDTDDDKFLVDLKENAQEFIIARGGKGGKGNARFTKATRKVPKFAEKGGKGESRKIQLELKLLADVGLLGYPNVGKSTFISRVSRAKPRIASYHFTTLKPNLGVVSYGDYKSFVIADIPGLIEGAHQGTGLGYEFLRHLERTRLLIHVLDIAGSEGRDPLEDFAIINKELKNYNEKLARLPQILALNKIDLLPEDNNLEKFIKIFSNQGYMAYPISAVSGKGVKDLIYKTGAMLEEIPEETVIDYDKEEVIIRPDFMKKDDIIIRKSNNIYNITGKLVDEVVNKTDLNNEVALKRMLRILKHHGLNDRMKEEGIQDGDTVKIGSIEFDYVE